ncbi:MAG: hypothetical protein N2486_08720 [Caloramator sp.]|nr:hypothetical protein [Caloramator sp.]
MFINIEKDEVVSFFKDLFKKYDFNFYLVGGAIRDKILSLEPMDYDFAVEAEEENYFDIMDDLSKKLNIEFEFHKHYKTATFKYKDKRIDLAMSRREFYPIPASKPIVIPTNIHEDLKRRDFTINSLAYDLKDEILIDPFNGIEDIKDRRIKVLHDLSFRDDPSRIFRGIKYASRFNFYFEKKTFDLIKLALSNGYVNLLPGNRLRNEIIGTLQEKNINYTLSLFEELSLFNILIDSNLKLNLDFDMETFCNLEDEEKFIILFFNNDEKIILKTMEILNLSKNFILNCKFLKQVYKLIEGDVKDLYRYLILNKNRINNKVLYCLFSKNESIVNYIKNIDRVKINFKGLKVEEAVNYKIEKLLKFWGR